MLGTYQVQTCKQDTNIKVEGSFQKYTTGGGSVILKHGTRGKIILQNDYILVVQLQQAAWLHLICSVLCLTP
jgi:hypothetical protein